MHKADLHNDELIDLGSVVAETKGGAPNQGDSLFQEQNFFGGIADD